jgi:hypothetical protein
VSVNGRTGDSQGFGDLGVTFPIGMAGLGECEGIGFHDGGATAGAALGTGCGQTSQGPFTDHGALECGERGHYDKELILFSGRTVGSGEKMQADSPLVEAVGVAKHVLRRPAETVQFPHAQGVRRTEMIESFNEPRAGGGASGDLAVKDPAAARRFKGVALELGFLPVVETRALPLTVGPEWRFSCKVKWRFAISKRPHPMQCSAQGVSRRLLVALKPTSLS